MHKVGLARCLILIGVGTLPTMSSTKVIRILRGLASNPQIVLSTSFLVLIFIL